ncbi:prolyl oligopeptidase family serine peptidase [Gudongella sp. DL1XJH-153]|uniref:S9 family peptidase n=1 Tax=Gudongella sp. DL1XJH-153 TaxID=3409804 RepID=UPI003BB68FC0
MENLRPEDLTKFKFLSGVDLSPDGKTCGFVVHTADEEENKYNSNIFVWDEHNGARQLTSTDSEGSFVWKNNDRLLFPSLRDKKDKEKKDKGYPLTSFYEISINGGEAKKAFQVFLDVSKIEYLGDNKYILLGSFDKRLGDVQGLDEDVIEKKIKDIKKENEFQVLDEIPFWADGGDFTNKRRTRCYIFDSSNGKLTSVTDEFTNVESIAVNPSKDRALLVTSSFTDKMSTSNQLYQLNLVEETCEKISPISDFNYYYADYIDDRIIFVGTDMLTCGINENPRIFVTEDEGLSFVRIAEPDWSLWSSVNSDTRYGGNRSYKVSGEYLYFLSTKEYNCHIFRISLDGNLEQLSIHDGSVDGFDVIEDKIIFVGMRDLYLQELYRLDDQEHRLTNYNDWVIQDRKLSTPMVLSYNNDETNLTGWVLKPVDFDKNLKYPAILNIHGGPKTVFGGVFHHEMQLWANQGYFVFYMNPRGSDGYGDEFSDIRGKYGNIDYEDLMLFTDKVLETFPSVDRENIGVTGGSYGGYMTNWIIGHTKRFKAAVSQRSISNWFSFFGTSDIGYYFAEDQVGATPWDNYSVLWDNSPLKYADKVETPTLFIHSDKDYRCWIPEGLQMYTALKYHGVDSRMVVFKNESHGLSREGRPQGRLRRLNEILEWFARHLKK